MAAAEVAARRPASQSSSPFLREQLLWPRVNEAAEARQETIEALFREKHLSFPPKRILIRAFKQERVLQLWATGDRGADYIAVKSWPICQSSGGPGPKRREGDYQVPEGFYELSGFNPNSNYYLSLQVDYPNQSDRILGGKGNLGGEIFIHGGCVTIGCIPITNSGIQELYLIAVAARAAGQARIPVQIFPTRLDDQGMAMLKRYEDADRHMSFWINLKEGFDLFEKHHRLPEVSVDDKGKYVFRLP